MTFRILAALSSVGALAVAIVACSAPPDAAQPENVAQQQQGICLNYPCTPPTTNRYGGLFNTSGGVVQYDPGGYTFACKGRVPSTDGYVYEIVPVDGGNVCVITDPNGCKDSGTSNFVSTQSDGGCWGYTILSSYTCPANHPYISCDPYTGSCTCY
jgi:hypothetical protein